MADNQSLTMEPEARQLKVEVEEKLGELNNQLSQNQNQGQVNNAQIEKNITDIIALRARIDALDTGGSPNTAGNPALLDRFPLQPADVVKMLQQSAEQKAQGQAYAGKYALTPQRFDVDSNGRTSPAPYGLPPTNGTTFTNPDSLGVPIVTDSCGQYYDAATGIHYRWDQYNPVSTNWVGEHWFLPGPGLSVSLDGLKWVMIRLVLPTNGSPFKTAFWVDRDNRLGYGPNTLFISDTSNMYCLPNLTAAGGVNMGASPGPYQDHRLYWDSVVFNGFCVLTLNSGNNYVIVRSGPNIHSIQDSWTFSASNDPLIGQISRVECPSWVRMNDQVAGKPTLQVLTIAGQGGPGANTPRSNWFNSVAMGAGTYTVSGMTLSQPLRWVEWGFWAYAHLIVDPMQQDGTGTTKTACDTAVMNVGCYRWAQVNSPGSMPSPNFGYMGGQWIPADVKLINGVPYLLPNSKFAAAMTGRSYTQAGVAQGNNPVNPGWLMTINYRCDVWRAEMDVNAFAFTTGSTVRFHFGTLYVDYTFNSGVIDFIPNYSGQYVPYPNNQGGINDNSTRRMPMTRNFVTNQGNTLVWEYDNGRIRLYNTNTGEIMSELIWPNGLQLSAVEVLGNDFFIGGFTMTVNQDEGQNY